MITHLVPSKWPEEINIKRKLRLEEATNFPLGSFEEQSFNVVDRIGNLYAYFLKQGKEYNRKEGKRNIYDMTPCIGENRGHNIYEGYQFKDIWSDLLKLSFGLSEVRYKELFVLIYRLAYMMDCKIINGVVRFAPDKQVQEIMYNIQNEADSSLLKCNIMHLLVFLDLLAWNEDVKYQIAKPKDGEKPARNNGRINNLLSMISIPLLLRDMVNNVIENKEHLERIDFTQIIDIAQQFSRTRGVAPISNKQLVEKLSPYLVE